MEIVFLIGVAFTDYVDAKTLFSPKVTLDLVACRDELRTHIVVLLCLLARQAFWRRCRARLRSGDLVLDGTNRCSWILSHPFCSTVVPVCFRLCAVISSIPYSWLPAWLLSLLPELW